MDFGDEASYVGLMDLRLGRFSPQRARQLQESDSEESKGGKNADTHENQSEGLEPPFDFIC